MVEPALHSVSPVLVCADLPRSVAYYRDALGFEEKMVSAAYARLARGGVEVHLCASEIADRPAGHGSCYIFASGVDALHAELTERGARGLQRPEDRPYGLRDFVCLDPDGNQIGFGETISTSSPPV